MRAEGLSIHDLAAHTRIVYNRWANVLALKTKLRHEEIEALGAAFPQYRHWLSFGEELPRCGQVRPKINS